MLPKVIRGEEADFGKFKRAKAQLIDPNIDLFSGFGISSASVS
jgi:hypothetical protein